MTPSETEKAFDLLAQEVFALDTAIQSLALEKAAREPLWARRDSETNSLCADTTTRAADLVDPLLLRLAEGRDGLYGSEEGTNPHRLLFVVLTYADFVQIVARFGRYDYVTVAVDTGADAYALGRRLTNLLDRYTQQ